MKATLSILLVLPNAEILLFSGWRLDDCCIFYCALSSYIFLCLTGSASVIREARAKSQNQLADDAAVSAHVLLFRDNNMQASLATAHISTVQAVLVLMVLIKTKIDSRGSTPKHSETNNHGHGRAVEMKQIEPV